jgi:hypothetical protein
MSVTLGDARQAIMVREYRGASYRGAVISWNGHEITVSKDDIPDLIAALARISGDLP